MIVAVVDEEMRILRQDAGRKQPTREMRSGKDLEGVGRQCEMNPTTEIGYSRVALWRGIRRRVFSHDDVGENKGDGGKKDR